MTRRAKKNRNQHEHTETSGSFFKQKAAVSVQRKKEGAFFQAKLTVGKPDDKYEKEADNVADKVVNTPASGIETVQKKDISTLQRLSTSEEDESFSTNEERMTREQDIQRKAEIQKANKPLEEEDMNGTSGVQRQLVAGGGSASTKVSSGISQTAGRGRSMPAKTLGEMQSAFGKDFTNVNIHTGQDAADMNKELDAQAFTKGNDIYFNSGNYNPESAKGKKLLAHELTHVVQQSSQETGD